MSSELSTLLEKLYLVPYDTKFSEDFEHVESVRGVASLWRIVTEHAKERQMLPGRLRT